MRVGTPPATIQTSGSLRPPSSLSSDSSHHPRRILLLPSCHPSAPWAQDYGASSNNKQGPGQRTLGGCTVRPALTRLRGMDFASSLLGLSLPSPHTPIL